MQYLFVVIPILIMLAGILTMFFPRVAWKLSEGWKYKNMEPSNGALVAQRIVGGIVAIFAVIFIVFLYNM